MVVSLQTSRMMGILRSSLLPMRKLRFRGGEGLAAGTQLVQGHHGCSEARGKPREVRQSQTTQPDSLGKGLCALSLSAGTLGARERQAVTWLPMERHDKRECISRRKEWKGVRGRRQVE